jgi:Adenylate and Guanylate cyclase catalytic domain
MREPSQVFILLESLYHAFDEIAKRRRVFKVETVGDCYVAVTGLPEPREDHAVVMARFANDCLKITRSLTKKLIVVLGPDTEDLTMRCVSGMLQIFLLRRKFLLLNSISDHFIPCLNDRVFIPVQVSRCSVL